MIELETHYVHNCSVGDSGWVIRPRGSASCWSVTEPLRPGNLDTATGTTTTTTRRSFQILQEPLTRESGR